MISLGLTKWFESYKINDASKILVIAPANTRGLPRNIEELKLGNYSYAFKFELPLHKDIQSGIQGAKNAIKEYLNPIFLKAAAHFTDFTALFPMTAGKPLFENLYQGVHLLFTNVPFSDVPWYVCNKEVT